jgi:hypothetical protein
MSEPVVAALRNAHTIDAKGRLNPPPSVFESSITAGSCTPDIKMAVPTDLLAAIVRRVYALDNEVEVM